MLLVRMIKQVTLRSISISMAKVDMSTPGSSASFSLYHSRSVADSSFF